MVHENTKFPRCWAKAGEQTSKHLLLRRRPSAGLPRQLDGELFGKALARQGSGVMPVPAHDAAGLGPKILRSITERASKHANGHAAMPRRIRLEVKTHRMQSAEQHSWSRIRGW